MIEILSIIVYQSGPNIHCTKPKPIVKENKCFKFLFGNAYIKLAKGYTKNNEIVYFTKVKSMPNEVAIG